MIFFHRILINFGIKGNWKFPHSTQSCYFKWALLKYYFNKGYDSKQRMIIVYIYINTNEIPGERLHKNMISSHVKITCYLHTWNITIAMAIINCAYYSKNLLKWNGLVFHWCLYNKHYMAPWRYEICLNSHVEKIFHSLAALTKYFSTLKDKFCISAQPCNILYILIQIGMNCVTTMLHKDKLKALKQRVKKRARTLKLQRGCVTVVWFILSIIPICLVPRSHYCVRPMCFESHGPRSRIGHWNATRRPGKTPYRD